jgi:hypothetical protein
VTVLLGDTRGRITGTSWEADSCLQGEHLGGQAVTAASALALAHRHGMELGIGLGNDLGNALALDGRVALQTQGREQDGIAQVARHRARRDDVEGALDPRVHHEVASRDPGDGLDHCADLGIHEVEGHRLAGARFVGQGRCGRQGEGQGDGGGETGGKKPAGEPRVAAGVFHWLGTGWT